MNAGGGTMRLGLFLALLVPLIDFTRANAEMVRWFEQHLRERRCEFR